LALLWRVQWTPTAFAIALGTGMVALLVNLSVSGGIGFASVATLLWILAGLAFAEEARHGTAIGPVRFAPLLGTLAVALVYFLNVYYPIWTAAGHSRAGLMAARKYLDDTQREPNRLAPTTQADLVRRLVVGPLQKAAQEDPTNSWNWLQLANWHTVQWTLVPTNRDAALLARDAIQRAEKLDPQGTAPLLAKHRMLLRFIEFSERAAEETEKLRAQADPAARRQLAEDVARHRANARHEALAAVEALERARQLDPYDARLRYQLAEALFKAGKSSDAFAELREAIRLDDLVVQNSPERPVRSLSDRQRKQIDDWLSDAPPPPALAPPLPRR
jgi:cytochrome c-type biogenesis protein CcmH/NrfG